MVSAVATLEPEIAAKIVQAAMVAIAHAARQVARQRVRGVVQVVDDPAADHDVRHEGEQRNRHQQVAVQLAEDHLGDRAQPALRCDQQPAAEQRQAGEDRQPGEQQQHQAGEDQRDRHSVLSPWRRLRRERGGAGAAAARCDSSETSSISTPPSGRNSCSQNTGISRWPSVSDADLAREHRRAPAVDDQDDRHDQHRERRPELRPEAARARQAW